MKYFSYYVEIRHEKTNVSIDNALYMTSSQGQHDGAMVEVLEEFSILLGPREAVTVSRRDHKAGTPKKWCIQFG